MIFNGERTIYNIKLINSLLTGVPYKPQFNTTLNEKFNILLDVDDTEKIGNPQLHFITIGIGEKIGDQEDLSRLNLKLSPHRPIDGALFKHLPFYLRPVNDVEHQVSPKYCLKKIVNIHGVDYVAYYGYRIIDFLHKDDIIQFKNIEDEYVNISKYDLNDPSILNPKPRSNIDAVGMDRTYLGDFFKIYMFFTEKELEELMNAKNILYPNEYPVITEIGVCHGIPYKKGDIDDFVDSQISYFMDVQLDIEDALKEGYMDFYLEIGGMEILIN